VEFRALLEEAAFTLLRVLATASPGSGAALSGADITPASRW
jgi:hypothetical protein